MKRDIETLRREEKRRDEKRERGKQTKRRRWRRCKCLYNLEANNASVRSPLIDPSSPFVCLVVIMSDKQAARLYYFSRA